MAEVINIDIQKTQNSRIETLDAKNIPFGKLYSDHMYIADFRDGAWGNSRILPYGEILMSPASPTINYAHSIFEGMKGYRSVNNELLLFRPIDNFKRLNVSAERMCMPQIPEEVFMEGLDALLKLDKDWFPDEPGTSLYIRPILFSKDDYIGIKPSDKFDLMIITCPVGAYYSEPVSVKVETEYTRAAAGGTGSAKTAGNYAASLYPALLAQKQGFDQLLWTDGVHHEYIEESGTMNVMFVIDGVLRTAPASDTILHGITRDSVLTLAQDFGMEVEEKAVSVTELIDAIKTGRLTEAFGTGTAATIAQIKSIGHNGDLYELPDVPSREFSNKTLQYLDDLKLGKIEDKHGWIYKV